MVRRGGRRWTIATLAFVGLAVVAGCGEPPSDRIPGPKQLSGEVPETVATITVDDDGFDPIEVTVVAGEAIDLVNDGERAHGFDGGEDFGTGLLEPGERSTLVLHDAGDYPFTDPTEPANEGVIVVEPDPDDPDTNADS